MFNIKKKSFILVFILLGFCKTLAKKYFKKKYVDFFLFNLGKVEMVEQQRWHEYGNRYSEWGRYSCPQRESGPAI